MSHASYHPPPIRDLEAPELEAVVEVMFLAAFADGDFGEEERVHFLKSIESLTDRSLSGETLAHLVTRITGELQTKGRAAQLASVAERIGPSEAEIHEQPVPPNPDLAFA